MREGIGKQEEAPTGTKVLVCPFHSSAFPSASPSVLQLLKGTKINKVRAVTENRAKISS
jgi:hypothetical protein